MSLLCPSYVPLMYLLYPSYIPLMPLDGTVLGMSRYNGQCPSGLCKDNAMGFKLGECYTNEKVGRCSKCTLKQIDDQCNDNAECCSNFCRGSNRPGTQEYESIKSAKIKCMHVHC